MNSTGILKHDWPRATLSSSVNHTTAKSLLVENFVHGWGKMTRLPTWRHFFDGGVLRRLGFLGNLKASDKQLGLRRPPTRMKQFYCLSHVLRHTIPRLIQGPHQKPQQLQSPKTSALRICRKYMTRISVGWSCW